VQRKIINFQVLIFERSSASEEILTLFELFNVDVLARVEDISTLDVKYDTALQLVSAKVIEPTDSIEAAQPVYLR